MLQIYDVYVVVQYTILCTFEKMMGKLTKIFPIQVGLTDFLYSGGGFKKGFNWPIQHENMHAKLEF